MEAAAVDRNTKAREKVKNVARPDDVAPTDELSKLAKQAEIKVKIIDEQSTIHSVHVKVYDKKGAEKLKSDEFHKHVKNHGGEYHYSSDKGVAFKFKNASDAEKFHRSTTQKYRDLGSENDGPMTVNEANTRKLEKEDDNFGADFKAQGDRIQGMLDKDKASMLAKKTSQASVPVSLPTSSTSDPVSIPQGASKIGIGPNDQGPVDKFFGNFNRKIFSKEEISQINTRVNEVKGGDQSLHSARAVKGGVTEIDIHPKTVDRDTETDKSPAKSKKIFKDQGIFNKEIQKEEAEQLDEVGNTPAGKNALKQVQARADHHIMSSMGDGGVLNNRNYDPADLKKNVRVSLQAAKRLNKEDSEIDEQDIHFGNIGTGIQSKMRAALSRRRELEKQSSTRKMNLHAGDNNDSQDDQDPVKKLSSALDKMPDVMSAVSKSAGKTPEQAQAASAATKDLLDKSKAGTATRKDASDYFNTIISPEDRKRFGKDINKTLSFYKEDAKMATVPLPPVRPKDTASSSVPLPPKKPKDKNANIDSNQGGMNPPAGKGYGGADTGMNTIESVLGAGELDLIEKINLMHEDDSFGSAFASARKKAGGAGGKFTYKGKEYQTNVAGEKYVSNPKSVDEPANPGVSSGTRPSEVPDSKPAEPKNPGVSSGTRPSEVPDSKPASKPDTTPSVAPQTKPRLSTTVAGLVNKDQNRDKQDPGRTAGDVKDYFKKKPEYRAKAKDIYPDAEDDTDTNESIIFTADELAHFASLAEAKKSMKLPMNRPTIGNQAGEKGDQSGENPTNSTARYDISDEKKLVGKQYKLDKNHNGKIDAKDFRLLHKEETLDEAIKSAFKLGNEVTIHNPGSSLHGKKGTVGKIHRGIPGSKKLYYTVYHGDRSSQFPKENLRIVKEDSDGDTLAAAERQYAANKLNMVKGKSVNTPQMTDTYPSSDTSKYTTGGTAKYRANKGQSMSQSDFEKLANESHNSISLLAKFIEEEEAKRGKGRPKKAKSEDGDTPSENRANLVAQISDKKPDNNGHLTLDIDGEKHKVHLKHVQKFLGSYHAAQGAEMKDAVERGFKSMITGKSYAPKPRVSLGGSKR